MARKRRIPKQSARPVPSAPRWQHRLHEIIFEADTPLGKAFDVILLISIAASVIIVMLESVPSLYLRYGPVFLTLEWVFTILFTIEYVARLIAVRRALLYALSFYGLVDLLAFLPTYLSLLAPSAHYLMVVRVLRLLRVFRVLKLGEFLVEADLLARALHNSRRKIFVFMLTVMTLVVIIGTSIYVLEGPVYGFTDIPTSMYWAIVTLTTVGYGDLAPITPVGKALASLVMLIGYSIIAVPTGIVTVEMARSSGAVVSTQACQECGAEGHDEDAVFCKYCGAQLNPDEEAYERTGAKVKQ
jgi:voltage-gated potassium channel